MTKLYIKKFGNEYYLCSKKRTNGRKYKVDFYAKRGMGIGKIYTPSELQGIWFRCKIEKIEKPTMA